MNKQQLAAKIWQSANAMRSKIEANEYKDYILGFIFYKFLSDSEEQFLLKNQMERKDFAAVLVEDDRDLVTFVQGDLGYFIEYKHLYSTWLASGADFNVGDVRDALSAFERNISPTHKALFGGIFNTLQTGLSNLGRNATEQTKAIRDLLKLIRDIPMDGRQGYDVLGFIYEYLISNFAANAGKKAGEFYTPHEVSLLMSRIIAKHLAGRSEIQIYDPTSGSGSLLLNIGQAVAHRLGDPDRIKYYAQELKSNTYNLTRMNLVMRGIKPGNIVARNADSLEADWPLFDEEDPVGSYQRLFVDAVVSNPPYSQPWKPAGKANDPRFKGFGLAPDSKADFAFLLHELYHVKPDGIMTIVLPHGVLFRGGSEAAIRKELIEQNNIDAVIGLPANIFYGTGIPTIIMVLKKNRETSDVLFIDASQNFLKVGKNNELRAADIRRISDAVEHRTDIERFARVVSRDEIRENDYNLNIPRYVSAAAPAEPVDLYATMYGGIPEAELDSLRAYWDVLPGLRETLFTPTSPGYIKAGVDDIHAAIMAHPAVAAFQELAPKALDGLAADLHQKLVDGRATVKPVQAEAELTADVFARFASVPLVDQYDAFQILHDQWRDVANDLEIIQTEGDQAIRTIEPVYVIKTRNKEKVEVQDGWRGRVIPFELVQSQLLPDQLAKLETLTDQLSTVDDELAQMFEGFSEEDLNDLAAVLNDAGDAFAKTKLSAAVKKLLRTRQTFAEDSTEARQIRANELLDAQASLKKEHKAAVESLETATHDAIKSLSDDQVDELLTAKWVQPIDTQLANLPAIALSKLDREIQHLRDKYAVAMVDLGQEIQQTEHELGGLLGGLVGGASDMAALAALQELLGGSHE